MIHSASLVWATPDAERLIAYIARVSSPERQGSDHVKLISWLIRKKHWSPFEMASMCVEINTTRDIGRQILRHRSFSFQEFSQRWSVNSKLGIAAPPECRLQNADAREYPLECDDNDLSDWWEFSANSVNEAARKAYEAAIAKGIAREVARAVLPEGMTSTRMYMSGTFRSWVHYLQLRLTSDTQAEHRAVAGAIARLFEKIATNTYQCAISKTNRSGS